MSLFPLCINIGNLEEKYFVLFSRLQHSKTPLKLHPHKPLTTQVGISSYVPCVELIYLQININIYGRSIVFSWGKLKDKEPYIQSLYIIAVVNESLIQFPIREGICAHTANSTSKLVLSNSILKIGLTRNG